jgi:vesicular inhibitory amino acid transporter
MGDSGTEEIQTPFLSPSFNQSLNYLSRSPTPSNRSSPRKVLVQEDDPLLENEVSEIHHGSTFIQSVINTTNVLVGIGILGFPFAFKNAGWIGGFALLFLTICSTNYTSKLLGRCLGMYFPKLQSFSDIGREAFGPKMEWFIGFVFFVELFLACAAYLIICGDNLEKLIPQYFNAKEWMLITAILVLPTTWLKNLAMISYVSAFGLIASIFLLITILLSGLTTPSGPGSLLHPEETILFDLHSFPIALGLIMVCKFSSLNYFSKKINCI